MGEPSLQGLRFLVVEDEYMIAALLEDFLSDLGCRMAWSAGEVGEALQLIEAETDIDAAILDMNLHGRPIDPVAGALASRRIPFCFMTGYGSTAVSDYPGVPILSKPFNARSVGEIIAKLVSPAG